MTEIQVSARFSIHNGKYDEFVGLADEIIEIVREQDGGTQQYDWFFNENHDECVVRETYADSDALLEHIDHVGASLARLLELSDISIEIYGDPSVELLEASADLEPAVYHFHAGLDG
ncbi:MAG: antibiotic biosynthesis monooxygenase [Gemmatimonadetes bacterium]|nr:antibiotic biosynthesis monooxygenase [Gemmatimonadota bacterium]